MVTLHEGVNELQFISKKVNITVQPAGRETPTLKSTNGSKKTPICITELLVKFFFYTVVRAITFKSHFLVRSNRLVSGAEYFLFTRHNSARKHNSSC